MPKIPFISFAPIFFQHFRDESTRVTNSNKKKKHVTRKKTQRWQKRSRRIISNHPAYHPWLTLYIWRYIGLTLDRIARWRKPVHVIRVEFNFLRTRDARVAHRAWVCVHTRVYSRVIRTTRWKRMDKEGRGQEPWTTFRLPIRVRSIHVCITFDTGAADISLHSYISWYSQDLCVWQRCNARRFLELVYTYMFWPLSKRWKRSVIGEKEKKRWVVYWMSGKAIVKWDVMYGVYVCVCVYEDIWRWSD